MSYDVNVGDAVGGIVGGKATLVSTGAAPDGMRLAAIGNALESQGTQLTNERGSPPVAAFNSASVGHVATMVATPTAPAHTRQFTA